MYLLLLQIYKEVFRKCIKFHGKRSPLKLLNKILTKMPKKEFIFSKIAPSKNEFTYFSEFWLKV